MNGSKNKYRIKSTPSEEYLYAGLDDLKRYDNRRRVLTWTDHTTSPLHENKKEFWEEQPDWEIIKVDKGFIIKNVGFSEFLYADADDFPYGPNLRSVFTWKDLSSLGDGGVDNKN